MFYSVDMRIAARDEFHGDGGWTQQVAATEQGAISTSMRLGRYVDF